MRKRCTMCGQKARERSFTCSVECETQRNWKQFGLDRHGKRSKVAGTYVVTVEDWVDIVKSFDHKCAYCGRAGQKLTVDHVLPLSRGGRHCVANIVPACNNCNQRKSNLTYAEWKHYTRGQRQSRKQKLSNARNPQWRMAAFGVVPCKNYKRAEAPIFDQVMHEHEATNMLADFGLTVDYYGIGV